LAAVVAAVNWVLEGAACPGTGRSDPVQSLKVARRQRLTFGKERRADAVFSELLEVMVAHLGHLAEPEAVGRAALTVRFASSGLARWERDSEAGVGGVAPLASFTLILTDLAVAMLDAPSSVPPQIDAHPRDPRLAGRGGGAEASSRSRHSSAGT
jgi:hypothetical protein